MTESILTSIKAMLGFDEEYTAFDLDIRLWINSALATLNQLGVGPDDGLTITDKTTAWDAFVEPGPQLDLIKTYVYVRTRYNFDPPGTGFHTTATKEVMQEHEWRIREMSELKNWTPPAPLTPDGEDPVLDPLDPFGDSIILDGG